MSNHIDPKIQEIIDRHEYDKALYAPKVLLSPPYKDRAYLLSEYKRLQEENEELRETANKFNEFAPQYAEFERMKEALEWYGDKKTYETNLNDQWEPTTLIDQDLGEKARAALSHLKGE